MPVLEKKCALERTREEVILNPFFSEPFWMPRKEIDVIFVIVRVEERNTSSVSF